VSAGDLARGTRSSAGNERNDSSADGPGSVASEVGLIRAARVQAQHRSRPAMQGIGLAAGIPGYTIVRELHRGGQGVVYLARQEGTGRQVAIKLMREGALARQSDRIRFEREIQVLAQLDNPNIVTIHDSGIAGGCGYYVMDYIAGRKLDDYVTQNELSVEDTLRLFGKICRAINAAHLRGVIHRDIKPGNIRVTPEGEPHVLDFGLAKLEAVDGHVSAAPTQMTATGQFIGSLPWASPEQAKGDMEKIDVRTDVYALGVILYQLLTDRFPYRINGPMPEVVGRIMNEVPPRPGTINPQVRGDLDTITLKALAKSREARYQTPGDLARDIDRCLAGEPIAAKRDNIGYLSRKLLGRYWMPIAGVLAVAGLGLVAATALVVGPEEGFPEETMLRVELGRVGAELETATGETRRLRERVAALEAALRERGIEPPAP
jgi:serine/threonine protein kinase